LVQYHSEPFRVNLSTNIPKLVIAQYHATLPEYKRCKIVRNPIDIYDKSFFPKYISDKIRIGYSPSTLKPSSKWANKGYEETMLVLSELKKQYGELIDVDVIVGVGLLECLERKSKTNIFIDEVVTPSYHRSGLESLAMGIATVCSVGIEVERIMLKASGSTLNPFINSNVQHLYSTLVNLIESGIDMVLNKGYESRVWMEKHWHPSVVASEYINQYKNLFEQQQ
jgi:hypothetical protein